MKGKNTLIAFLILIILGGYIWIFERKQLTTEERQEREKKAFSFKSEEVAKLTLRRKEDTVTFEKQDERWRLVSPLAVKADQAEVDSLLSRLEFLEIERRLEEEKNKTLNLEEFGLEEPQLEVSIWVNEQPQTLLVGGVTPDEKNLYVKLTDVPDVLIVRKQVLGALTKEVSDYREKKLLEIAKYDVNRLELVYPDRKIECVMQEDRWRLTQPIEGRGDGMKIEELIGKLEELKAEEFVFDGTVELEKYGFDQPLLEATVWQGEEKLSQVLVIGKHQEGNDNRIYAMRRGMDTVYAVKADILGELTKQPNDLRDRKVVRFNRKEVENVRITQGEQEINLAYQEGEWRLTVPKEVRAERSAVDELLAKLENWEIKEFITESPDDLAVYGLTEPRGELVITLQGGKEGEKVLFGRVEKKSGAVYIKRSGADSVFSVAGECFDLLGKEYFTYRIREVLTLEKDKVVELTHVYRDREILCRKGAEGWRMIKPEEGEVKESVIDDLLLTLNGLRAEQFVSGELNKLKPYGLDKPKLKLVFKTSDYEDTILIGKEKDSGESSYALLESLPLVFLCQKADVERLMKDVDDLLVVEEESSLPLETEN